MKIGPKAEHLDIGKLEITFNGNHQTLYRCPDCLVHWRSMKAAGHCAHPIDGVVTVIPTNGKDYEFKMAITESEKLDR